uniref:Pheromone binding protein 3 n=1 Tax=Odontomachus monticola TaxID=613454 RepID=A0A348G655_ODOMO
MKLTLLLFFTLVTYVATMGVEYEGMVESIANFLELTKDEVRPCFNMTGITQEDVMEFAQVKVDDLQTTNANIIASKMGCLMACLGEKKEIMTDARINVDKTKEIIHSMVEKQNIRLSKLPEFDQKVDSCANLVETVTYKCEVALTFVYCLCT